MIRLNEVAKAGSFITIYKDSEDPRLFYYIPRFAELGKRDDGSLIFGMMLFKRNANDPNDGASVYNMTVRAVMPGAELQNAKRELEAMTGGPVSIVPIPGYNLSIKPITDFSFVMRGGRVQEQGGNLFTDLAISMTFEELAEPDMSTLFKSAAAWTGAIYYKVTGMLTPFKAAVRINWRQVHDHFKSQVSVKHWFISANLSHETEKLIRDGVIDIQITGGTPEQKDKVYAMAKQIADRLFVPSIKINPLPDHPGGSVVGFSVDHTHSEQNETITYNAEELAHEERNLGMAIAVGNVPASYFRGLAPNSPLILSLDTPLTQQAAKILDDIRRDARLSSVKSPRELEAVS